MVQQFGECKLLQKQSVPHREAVKVQKNTKQNLP